MTLRKKIFLAVVLLFASVVAFGVITHYRAKARLDACKKKLIEQGEKLTISEGIPVVPTVSNGAEQLQRAGRQIGAQGSSFSVAMRTVKPGVARVGWRQTDLMEEQQKRELTNAWPVLEEIFHERQDALQLLRDATTNTALHFLIDYHARGSLLLPHLSTMKAATRALTDATVLALHRNQTEEAFQNLLAAIRLPCLYTNEYLLISQLVRIAMIAIAVAPTWEALQSDAFSDDQWAQLQRQWEQVEVWQGMEDALAMERAYLVSYFLDAKKSLSGLEQSITGSAPGGGGGLDDLMDFGKELVDSPKETLQALAYRFPGYWLWKHWYSYDEEIFVLDHFQQMLDVVRLSKNEKSCLRLVDFAEKQVDPLAEVSPYDPHFMVSRLALPAYQKSLLRAHRVLAQRELVVAAIALKRFHLRHGIFPEQLAELEPDFLREPRPDLMNHQPLHYQRKSDGTFVLYGIGENYKDDGGNPAPYNSKSKHLSYTRGLDWVWPRAATPEEVKAFDEERLAER